eukprot:353216-Karenia_brevis.AAC.1
MSDFHRAVDAQLVKDENEEWEREAAKFEEGTRLLCETHEKEKLDRTITPPDADMSVGKHNVEYRNTTGSAPPGQWFR